MPQTPAPARSCNDAAAAVGDTHAHVSSTTGARHTGDEFTARLESWRERMELALAARLPAPDIAPARLHQAMRYSVLGGGKRVRPALLFAAARAVGLAEEDVEAAACALEWLRSQQLRDEPGDWRISRPALAGGGWAFQFANGFYPDLDDTGVICLLYTSRCV